MTLTLFAAVAAGVVADGSLRVEGRGGSSEGGQEPNAALVSAEVNARAPGPDGALRFGASPSVVFADGSQIFARAYAEAELRFRRGASARLRQTFGYGSLDLSPVAPVDAARAIQPPPQSRFVSVAESSTAIEWDVAASRRVRVAGSAAWLIQGGADAQARTVLPLSRGPLARADVEWSATRRSTLRLEAQAFDFRYSSGRRASVAGLAAGVRTVLLRGTELSFSLGPALGRTQAEDQTASAQLYGLGTLDLRTAATRELSLAFGGSVEPVGDQLTGDLVQRASLRASAEWRRARAVTLALRAVGSAALSSGSGGPASPQAGDRYLQAEASAAMPLDPRSTLSAGARAASLSRPLPGQPAGQWVAFVDFTTQLPFFR